MYQQISITGISGWAYIFRRGGGEAPVFSVPDWWGFRTCDPYPGVHLASGTITVHSFLKVEHYSNKALSAIFLFPRHYPYNLCISRRPQNSSKYMYFTLEVSPVWTYIAMLLSLQWNYQLFTHFFQARRKLSIKYTGFCIIYQQKIHIKQEINAQIISLQKNTTGWPGVSVVQLGWMKSKGLCTVP